MPIGQYGNTVSGARSAGIGQIKLERLGDSLNPLAERLNKLENVALKKKEVQEARAYDDSVRQQQNQWTKERDDYLHTNKVSDMGIEFSLKEQSAENQVGRSNRVSDHTLENQLKRDANTFGNQKEMASINQGYSLDLLKKKESSAKRVAKYKKGLDKVDPSLAKSLSGVLDNMYVYSDKGYTKTDKANDIAKERNRIKSSYENEVVPSFSGRMKSLGVDGQLADNFATTIKDATDGNKDAKKELARLASTPEGKQAKVYDLYLSAMDMKKASDPKSKEFQDAIKEYSSRLPKYRDPVVDLPATQKNIATKKETLLRAGSQTKGSSAKYINLLAKELDANLNGVTKYLNASDKKVKDAETEAVNNAKATKDSQLKGMIGNYNTAIAAEMKDNNGFVSDEFKKTAMKSAGIRQDIKTKMFVPL